MRKINNIKIFTNKTNLSNEIEIKLKELLKEYRFNIVEKDYDCAIAIGGDGSFLRMVKDNNFNSDIYYIGINTGTLGFLQEIRPENLRYFVMSLNDNEFKVDEIGVLETEITSEDSVSRYFALNEIVIRELELNVFNADILIDNHKLEYFVGDGLLVSTSTGSTAYNISFNGAIVYNTLHTLQITPIAAINTKAYRNLLCPIILPEKSHITIIPKKDGVLTMCDGENKRYKEVKKIECFVKDKKLKFLRTKDYNFIDIVNEKFLTD